jgi:hypothetical protein
MAARAIGPFRFLIILLLFQGCLMFHTHYALMGFPGYRALPGMAGSKEKPDDQSQYNTDNGSHIVGDHILRGKISSRNISLGHLQQKTEGRQGRGCNQAHSNGRKKSRGIKRQKQKNDDPRYFVSPKTGIDFRKTGLGNKGRDDQKQDTPKPQRRKGFGYECPEGFERTFILL